MPNLNIGRASDIDSARILVHMAREEILTTVYIPFGYRDRINLNLLDDM